MDAFTEKILARARERQKMLEVYSTEKVPLRETNNTREPQVIHKQYVSDPVVNKKTENPDWTLKENKSESHLASFSRQNSRTRVSSDLPGSPKTQLKTLNIQQENFNMEIKLSSTDNVRVEVEINETDDSNEGDHEEVGMRDEAKNKLKRLGKLYSGCEEDISSPIHKTESKFYAEENFDQEKRIIGSCQKSPRKGLTKLARLAETINQWEDEVKKPDTGDQKPSSRKPSKSLAPQPPNTPPSKESPVKPSHKYKAPEPPTSKYFDDKNIEDNGSICIENADQNYNNLENEINNKNNISNTHEVNADKVVKPKKLNWDPKVLDKLESQGFTRTTSNARLVYSYNQREKYTELDQIEDKQGCGLETGKIKKLANLLEEKSNCSKDKLTESSKSNQNSPKEKLNSSKINLRGKIANKAALFETNPNSSPKDPALLSVSERKALFEKNKGEALIPKAAFAMSIPSKVEISTKPACTKTVTENKIKPSQTTTTNLETVKPIVHAPAKSPKNIANETTGDKVAAEAVVVQGKGISSTMAALLNNKSTISQEQIASSIKMQKQKDMEMLLNRFNRPKDVSLEPLGEESDDDEVDVSETTSMIPNKSAHIVSTMNNVSRRSAEKRKSGEKPYGNGDSPIVTAVLDEVKRIKVSPAKPGRLYPNLSDIEATTETETDNQTRTPTPDAHSSCEDNYESDDPNTSFGRDILEAVCKNQTPHKRPIYDESTESDLSSVLEDADDEYLEEFTGEQQVSIGPSRPKQVRHITPEKTLAAQPSNSFHYKNFNGNSNNTTENKFLSPSRKDVLSQNSTDLPEYIVEGEDVLPLTHTVSFYRKQQSQVNTPVRQITRQPIIEESPEKIVDDMKDVQIKIRSLEEEVNKQQNIISQTSQALNLCISTPEFSGSTEQVEAERVLLVATHRRQSALLELQRLRVEQTIRPQGQGVQNVPLEKGTLSISNIVLPLKHKYVKALAAAGGKGHHIVCLIKCAEQVVPTGLVSTIVCNTKNPDTEVKIPGTVVLNDIYSDFTVTFEVYCLQAQEEFLPHEVKYHINNKKSNNKLVTPKKSKQDSRMVMPIRESPGGPQAVRSSSFAMNGYVVFSLQAINRKNWSLNNTPTMSPLEGSVEMRIHCELAVSVEHRGFLTMFEDISGLGAWHRRWCLLIGHTLSYWKYPDDERKMAPIDTINLKNCMTKQVGPVSREICARLHTFLLERERAAHPKDKNSLVTVCNGDKTIIRHLLSADTKEERIEWCSKLNAALTTLKMWGNSK